MNLCWPLNLRIFGRDTEAPAPGPFGDHATLADGLVSYWDLDEQSGVRYDSVTASANDLTDNNTVGYVNLGPSGVVADFIPASSESLSTANTVLTADLDFTISVWVRPDNVGAITIAGDANGDLFLRFTASQTPQLFVRGFASNVERAGTLALNTWHHIVAWHDAGSDAIGIAVDAGAATTGSSGGANGALNTFLVGDGGGLSQFFDGRIGEVGLWNRVLTSDERTALYNAGRGKSYSDLTDDEKVGLVSYWNLDEVSGARYDSHGSNDLTDNNTVTSVVSGPRGVVAQFTAANTEYLSTTTQAFPANGDFTVVGWMKVTAGSAATGMIQWKTKDNANDQHGIFFEPENGSNHRLYNRRGYGSAVEVGDNRGKWVLTVYEYVHSTTTSRVMGLGTTTNSGVWSAGSSADLGAATDFFTLGREATIYMDGGQARTGVWSRTLSEDERTSLFNSGLGKSYSDLTDAEKVGLVSYWDLTETSGTRADSHGTNHLTDNNTVTYTINRPNFGVSANFVAGSSEYLNRASVDLTGCNTTGFSLSMWYKATGDEYWLYCRDDVTDREVVMGRQSGAIRWAPFDGVNDMVGSADAGDDAWSHILVTWDPADNKPRLYTNGGAAVVGGAGSDFFTDTVFVLGGRPATATFITGQIGPTALWNRVLTAQERSDLFNAGKGLFYGD